MFPVICQVGPLTLFSYGFMLLVAYGACVGWSVWRIKQWKGEPLPLKAEQVSDLIAFSLIGGVVGGRLFYVVTVWEALRHNWLEIFAIWHGGLVWYGGLAGGILTAVVWLRTQHMTFLRCADQLVPCIALGHALGRIGCFLNGCCYGLPTQAWFGVHFPGHEQAVIPAQLFESAGLFGLFAILWRMQTPQRLRTPGRLFGIYGVGYALLRFAIEFIRGDERIWLAGLTLPQWMSIGLLLVGLYFCLRPRPSAATPTQQS
jgi:phosphatidylglycerol:prolipoprotein diacylglycerol transferase